MSDDAKGLRGETGTHEHVLVAVALVSLAVINEPRGHTFATHEDVVILIETHLLGVPSMGSSETLADTSREVNWASLHEVHEQRRHGLNGRAGSDAARRVNSLISVCLS